jgi:hypothetical protein
MADYGKGFSIFESVSISGFQTTKLTILKVQVK